MRSGSGWPLAVAVVRRRRRLRVERALALAPAARRRRRQPPSPGRSWPARPPRRSTRSGAARRSPTSSPATASTTSTSHQLDPGARSIPAGCGPGWSSASASRLADSLPNQIWSAPAPEQRVVFTAVGRRLERRGRADRLASRADPDRGRDRQLALRGARRAGRRRPARRRRPAAAGLGPGRRLRLAGGLHPRHPAGRPLSGGLRAAGLRGRRGPVRTGARQRPDDVRQEPHRVPLRCRRPRRVLRRRRQLAPPRVPPRAGPVPPHLLQLRPRAASIRSSGITRRHEGTDYAAAPGTPVMAAGDGVVLRAGRAGGYGNLIELRHRNGITTRYGHLRGFARGIRAGARVEQGQTIGYVGLDRPRHRTAPALRVPGQRRRQGLAPRRARQRRADPATRSAPTSSRARPPARAAAARRVRAAVAAAPPPAAGNPRPGGCRSAPVVDLFPAIDIRHGRVVRLSQGEATRQTVYGDDPVAVAERFAEAGRALDPRGGSRPRLRRGRQPGAGAAHRRAGRSAGPAPARRRASDARSGARGARAGREPRRDRHRRRHRSRDACPRRSRPTARTGSPSGSTRGTARWRCAAGPRRPTLTADDLARRVVERGRRAP